MMKRILLVVSLVLMLVGLSACGGAKVDDVTVEKYQAVAEEVVFLLNKGDYAEVHTMFDEQMKEGLPVESMGQLTPLIEEAGSFEQVDKFSIEEKDGIYVTVLVAKYNEKKRIYTISFNEDEEVVGLFMK